MMHGDDEDTGDGGFPREEMIDGEVHIVEKVDGVRVEYPVGMRSDDENRGEECVDASGPDGGEAFDTPAEGCKAFNDDGDGSGDSEERHVEFAEDRDRGGVAVFAGEDLVSAMAGDRVLWVDDAGVVSVGEWE